MPERQATNNNMAGGPVRQPYAGVDFIPQSRIFEFGYRMRFSMSKELGGHSLRFSRISIAGSLLDFLWIDIDLEKRDRKQGNEVK